VGQKTEGMAKEGMGKQELIGARSPHFLPLMTNLAATKTERRKFILGRLVELFVWSTMTYLTARSSKLTLHG